IGMVSDIIADSRATSPGIRSSTTLRRLATTLLAPAHSSRSPRSMHCLQRRCPGRQRIAVIAQLVEQVALYRLTCRSDIDLTNPGGVLAENLVLRLGRQLRVTVLGSELFRYREGLESLDLPIRRSDHGCVGTPQNVIGTKAVEQVPDED